MKKTIGIISIFLNAILFGYNLGVQYFGFVTWVQAVGILGGLYLLHKAYFNLHKQRFNFNELNYIGKTFNEIKEETEAFNAEVSKMSVAEFIEKQHYLETHYPFVMQHIDRETIIFKLNNLKK